MPVDLRFGIGDSLPVTTEIDWGNQLPVLNDGRQYVDFSGGRGSRSRPANRVRNVGGTPSGSLPALNPSATELAILMKYIRSAADGSTPAKYAFAETLNAFAVTTKNSTGGAKRDQTGCKIARAEFSATKGQALQLALSWLALDMARSENAFPSLSISEASQPFVFEDAELPSGDPGVVVNGTTVTVFDISLSIDMGLVARQVNALRPTLLYPTDHIVEWQMSMPWSTYDTLDPLDPAGVSVSWFLANATHGLRFTSPKVAFPPQPLTANGREEEVLTLTGQARWSAAKGDELLVELDDIADF